MATKRDLRKTLFSFCFSVTSYVAENTLSVTVRDMAKVGDVIEVRAMDRNGNVGLAPAVFAFSVLTPWYKHAGFLFITAVGAECNLPFGPVWKSPPRYRRLRR